MSDYSTTQIICEDCTDYAKATLEGTRLCSGCLLRRLMSTHDASLFDRLKPLYVGTTSRALEVTNDQTPE